MENRSVYSQHPLKKKDWPPYISYFVENHPNKRYIYPEMAINWMYWKSDQYKSLNKKTSNIMDVAITRENRCTYNMIRPIERMSRAKMLANDPVARVTQHERNTQTVDEDAVEVADRLALSWWARQDWKRKLNRMMKHGNVMGSGIGKMYYDPEGGIEISKDAMMDLGLPEEEARSVTLGEMVFDTPMPNKELFQDTLARDDDEMRMFVHRYSVAQTTAEDFYGKKRGYFKAEDKHIEDEDALNASLSGNSARADDETQESDAVYVYELFWKRDKAYPNGKHVVVINEETIVDEDLAEPDRLPVYTFKINGSEDDFYGAGYTSDSRSIQRDSNKSNSLVMENMEWTGINKYYVDSTVCTINSKQLNNMAGEIIKGNGPNGITPIMAQGIPNEILKNPERLFAIMQIIWAVPDVDMGQMPYRGTGASAIALQTLKESSMMAHQEDMESITGFIQRVFMDYLWMVQKYYDDIEIAAIIGEPNLKKIEKFLKADIGPGSIDIRISIGEGFGESPAAKLDGFVKLVQAVPDEFPPGTVTKIVAELGNIDVLIEDITLDEQRAEDNFYEITHNPPAFTDEFGQPARDGNIDTSGMKGMVSMYDNYDVHIAIFKKMMKKMWHTLSDEAKAAIDAYIGIMTDNKMQAMMQQMPPAMPGPQGGPPGPQAGGGQGPQPPTRQGQINAESNLHMSPGQPGMGPNAPRDLTR